MDILSETALKDSMASLAGSGWSLTDDHRTLTKTFTFADFASALGWMVRIGVFADQLNHHPDWSNSYNKVRVALTTHDAGGITHLDIELASKMSESAD